MKISKLKLLAVNLTLLLALTGCVSKSYDKGAATSAALQSAAAGMGQTSQGIYDVLGALNNLTSKSTGDLRNQYDDLVAAAKKLALANDNLEAKVVAMRGAAGIFSENWSNQLATIQNPDLRTRSAGRLTEVNSQLQAVDANYLLVKNSLKPFMAGLVDIQTYLGTDLTAGGLASLKDQVAKVRVEALPLRDAIKQLQGSFSSLSAAISPVLPPATTK